MTTTQELIEWCEYKIKRMKRENPDSICHEEERLEQIRTRLLAAQEMADKASKLLSSICDESVVDAAGELGFCISKWKALI